MERNGQLARAEIGAEVATDLADRVDDVVAHLLRELLELVLAERLQVLGPVDAVEQRRHYEFLAYMKSVISSRSEVSPASSARAASSAARALSWELAASARARSRPKTLT